MDLGIMHDLAYIYLHKEEKDGYGPLACMWCSGFGWLVGWGSMPPCLLLASILELTAKTTRSSIIVPN